MWLLVKLSVESFVNIKFCFLWTTNIWWTRLLHFCQSRQYILCQLMFLSLPDKVTWHGSTISKLKTFAQFNRKRRLDKSHSAGVSWTAVVDASGDWQHYKLFRLKDNRQCSSGISQVMRVGWVAGHEFIKYDRRVIATNVVAFTATVRYVWEVICIATCLVTPQLREEELQKLFLCKDITWINYWLYASDLHKASLP